MPVAESASISATFAPMPTGSSFCRPSRGPTSRSEIRAGRSLTVSLSWPVRAPPLVERRDALFSVRGKRGGPPGGILDVEAGFQPGTPRMPKGTLSGLNSYRGITRDLPREVQRGGAGRPGWHPPVHEAEPLSLGDRPPGGR